MATLREIVKNIRRTVEKGDSSDDFRYTDRQLAFQVNYYRAKLLRQQIQKHKANYRAVQNLGRVTLVTADKNECCDIDACVLRTELPVPTFLTAPDEVVTYVGEIDGSNPYQKTSPQRLLWDGFAQYTKSLPKWYILNNYIYIINPTTTRLKYINIQGIFEDPIKAEQFRTCNCPGNNEDCSDGFDNEYPLDTSLIDMLNKLILQTEFQIYATTIEDTENETEQAKNQVSPT